MRFLINAHCRACYKWLLVPEEQKKVFLYFTYYLKRELNSFRKTCTLLFCDVVQLYNNLLIPLALKLVYFKKKKRKIYKKSHFETEFNKPRNGKSDILKRNPRGSTVLLPFKCPTLALHGQHRLNIFIVWQYCVSSLCIYITPTNQDHTVVCGYICNAHGMLQELLDPSPSTISTRHNKKERGNGTSWPD